MERIKCTIIGAIKWALLISLLNRSIYASVSTESNEVEYLENIEYEISVASPAELSLLETKISKILQKEPKSLMGNYLMSALLLKMFTHDPGSYSLIRQSAELAAQTFDINPSSDLAIAALANILEASGEIEKGISLLSESEKRGLPLKWRSNLAKAKLVFNGKNPTDALVFIERAIREQNSKKKIISETLILILTTSYSGRQLVSEIKYWKAICPSTEMHLALANAHALNSNFSEAVSEYLFVIKSDPKNSEALVSLGIIFSQNSNSAETAISYFRQAVSYAKNMREKSLSEMHLALSLISTKKLNEETFSMSISAISDANESETILIAVVNAFHRHQPKDHLISFFEKLKMKMPSLHLAYALEAEMLSEKYGRHVEAIRYFSDAIALESGRSEYYNGRGLSWMGLGKINQALEDFQTASATNPDDASARYNVACAHARLGNKSEALASLSKAFEIDRRLIETAGSDVDLASLRNLSEYRSLLNEKSREVILAH